MHRVRRNAPRSGQIKRPQLGSTPCCGRFQWLKQPLEEAAVCPYLVFFLARGLRGRGEKLSSAVAAWV